MLLNLLRLLIRWAWTFWLPLILSTESNFIPFFWVSKEGFFVFGLDRDRKFDVTISVTNSNSNKKIIKKVLKRKYKIQRIDGLDEKKVTPPEEVYSRIKKENNKIGKARSINSDLDSM